MKPFYERGGITIYCGDNALILPKLDIEFDTLIADPPYGVNHDTNYTRFTLGVSEKRNWGARIEGDKQPFNPLPWLDYRRVILWGANNYCDKLPPGAFLIWDKRNAGRSKDVMSDAETAWFNHGHGCYIFTHTWDGFVRASEKNTAYHPTQKPEALMAWCIERAKPQGVILDPFMGGGPVLRAAQFLGHQAVGIEISEEYCHAAVELLRQPSFFSIPAAVPAAQPRQVELTELIKRGLEK